MRPEIQETARKLAQGVASTLDSEDLPEIARAVVLIVGDIRSTADASETVEEFGVHFAESIAYILGTLTTTSISQVAEILETNSVAYALAAGVLAGVYELPELPDEIEAAHRHDLTMSEEEWEKFIRRHYL